MNILLIAEDAAGARTLQSLRQSGYQIVAVMASPSRQSGAGANLWSLAAKLGYTTWPTQLVKDSDFAAQVRAYQVDLILNVHSLFVIRREVLEAPRLGSYNLHPSLLPRYAGLNSVCWAIYRGERRHGVTLHKIEAELDTGPIVYQEVVEIDSDETGLSLTAKCVNIGVPLIMRLLETAAHDPSQISLIPQDLTRREYFGREVPANGILSWRMPAQQIFSFVRACDFSPFLSPWGHPRTKLIDRELGIVKARLTGKPVTEAPGIVGETNGSGIEVASADEWILVRQVLIDGKYLSAAAILRPGDQLDCAVDPAA
jgi:methionyl-tRNA formyltransferase